MSDDPEFAAELEGIRARIRADRERQDSELADLIERWSKRGAEWKPRNLPAVETTDYLQEAANDR